MADVTYYFITYSLLEKWTTTPQYMVDGRTNTFARECNSKVVQRLMSSDCPGGDLGTITKVEIRAFGYYTGAGVHKILLRPVFQGGDGANHEFDPPASPGNWSAWFDITTDPNAPPIWSWLAVLNLDCDVESQIIGIIPPICVYCSMVQIKVTYTPPAAGKSRGYII